jgi:hypothetical protein
MAHTPPSGGLWRERTALSWNRSGLAALVCIAVLLRHIWPLHGTGQDVALGLIAAAAMVWAVALLAFTTSAAGRESQPQERPRAIQLMTAGTIALSAVGFAVAFLPPS